MTTFKPMLACEAPPVEELQYPVMASPKLDGIRCIIHPELGPVTRKLKPIPNEGLRAALAELPAYLDGELIAGPPTAPDVMQRTTSAVMGHSADWGDVTFYVFDNYEVEGAAFHWRYGQVTGFLTQNPMARDYGMEYVDHLTVDTPEQLQEFEQQCVGLGFEGIMVRDPSGPYKFGRSTKREGYLMKVKRFADMEGVVVDVVERMHNANKLERDELGHAKRSAKKEGKVPAGTMGALTLQIEGWKSDVIDVGTGFDDAQRAEIWGNRAAYTGRIAKFKYQPSGSKDAPRFPVFLGWRSEED